MTSMDNMDPVKLAGRHHHPSHLMTSQQPRKHSEEKHLLHRKVKVKAATCGGTSVAHRVKEKTATVNKGKTTPEKHKHKAEQPASSAIHLRGQNLTSEAHDGKSLDDDNKNDNDVTQPESGVGFGALLDKVCTVRLHGDITDKMTHSPRQTNKRALRFGDRLHTATEVVEIVVHGCEVNNNNNNSNINNNQGNTGDDHSAQGIAINTTTTADNNNNNGVDTKEVDVDDENEAILLAAQASSFQRCQAWVGLHFDSDDASSQSSTNR